tara:strand:- start:3492 stop:4991 length:1500 start_codon:yes stop_codon:yes gene_type:complete
VFAAGEKVMKKIYIIGIGGTGAKCVRSAVHLHAAGAYGTDTQLGVMLIDADASNGNLQSARETLQIASDACEVMRDTQVSFFSGPIRNYGLWNPLGGYADRLTLSDIYREAGMRSSNLGLGELFDAFVSPEEKQADLSVGFRGRPSIGASVVSRIKNTQFSQGAWPDFMNDIQADCANGDTPRIHLFGSIFGGTGSSGLPTLGTLLDRELKGIRESVEITASVLLPYFDFDIPDDDDIYAESKNFTLNTDAALQYLARLAGDSFNCIYLLGDNVKQRYEASTGGPRQVNPCNCVELMAAAAAIADAGVGFGNGAYLTVSDAGVISWEDIPGDQTRKALRNAFRTLYAWHFNLYNELRESQKLVSKNSFTTGAPWFDRFFSLNDRSTRPNVESSEENLRIGRFDRWSVDFLQWIQEVSWSGTQREQLTVIRQDIFEQATGCEIEHKRTYVDNLDKIVIGESMARRDKWRNSIDLIKNKLADSKHRLEGVKGLVNSFYDLI